VKSKKKFLIVLFIILSSVGVIYFFRGYNFASLLPIPIRKVIPLYSRKTYSSIKEALQATNYLKYPTISLFIPIRGEYNSMQYNPKTNTQLGLDTSEGGGYACCEAPTFYVWVDRKDNIFWVETYQASLSSVNDHWYGPFKLQTSN